MRLNRWLLSLLLSMCSLWTFAETQTPQLFLLQCVRRVPLWLLAKQWLARWTIR